MLHGIAGKGVQDGWEVQGFAITEGYPLVPAADGEEQVILAQVLAESGDEVCSSPQSTKVRQTISKKGLWQKRAAAEKTQEKLEADGRPKAAKGACAFEAEDRRSVKDAGEGKWKSNKRSVCSQELFLDQS